MIDVNAFADMCNVYINYNTPQQNMLGAKVIFAHDANVATHAVFPFTRFTGRKFTLVTCRDLPVDDSRVASAPGNMIKWFGNNSMADDERVCGIPIGLPPINVESNPADKMTGARRRSVAMELMETTRHERNLVYMAHQNHTNVNARAKLYPMFKSKYWTTCRGGSYRIPYAEYIRDVHSHRFMICPPGAGLDCHRVWESLYLGTIPIVQRSRAMEYFEELPIVFVDDFEEVTPEFLESAPMGNQTRMLDMGYWRDLILSAVKDTD